ncbi:MAG: hypothetical protein M3Q71_05695 [Chloroflexota bacterium]|nr:hypothetical protein [Chloroflexota bacterium]
MQTRRPRRGENQFARTRPERLVDFFIRYRGELANLDADRPVVIPRADYLQARLRELRTVAAHYGIGFRNRRSER